MSTIAEGILRVLEDGEKTIQEIYASLPSKRSSIDKARSRLEKSGHIERVARGVYRKKALIWARRGRETEKISWEHLSEAEKTDYELTLIADVIESCCDLLDKAAYNQNADIREKVQSLVALFTSCASLVTGAQEELTDFGEAFDDGERAAVFANTENVPLKGLVRLLFERMSADPE